MPAEKRLLMIRWRDARDADGTWIDESDAHDFGDEDFLVTSVGYLIKETKKYYTIGADWIEVDKAYGRVVKIPTAMAVSVTDLAPTDSPAAPPQT